LTHTQPIHTIIFNSYMTWGQADIAILIEFRATHVEAILLNQLLLFYF